MENTLENKAKFSAQYIGRSFIALDCYTTLDHIRLDSESPFGWIDTLGQRIYTSGGKLILKPLSSITDEDSVEVAKLAISQSGLKNATVLFGKDVVSHIFYYEQWGYNIDLDGEICIEIYQYLQSKGYALPWMGLSVEKQIEYGWVRLS